jgi:hypothetical protein
VYLGFGFTVGAFMLAAPALQLPPMILRLRPFHAEVLLIGWMVQLTFGVAYWILPKLRAEPARRSERLAWISLLLLNLGLLAAGLGRTFGVPVVPIAGRASEMLAVLAFAFQAWPRARGYSTVRRD